MKTTTAEFSAELAALESQVTVLETQMRARGLDVHARPDVAAAKQAGATLDDIFSAMGLMESHAAKLRTTTRLATPLKYAPNATAKATGSNVKSFAQQLRDGEVTAAQISKAAEIRRIEGILATFKPGTTTHVALTKKVATLRAEMESLPKPTPEK